jgi:hypothetical protein
MATNIKISFGLKMDFLQDLSRVLLTVDDPCGIA